MKPSAIISRAFKINSVLPHEKAQKIGWAHIFFSTFEEYYNLWTFFIRKPF
jgi:hypothetical protein